MVWTKNDLYHPIKIKGMLHFLKTKFDVIELGIHFLVEITTANQWYSLH